MISFGASVLLWYLTTIRLFPTGSLKTKCGFSPLQRKCGRPGQLSPKGQPKKLSFFKVFSKLLSEGAIF